MHINNMADITAHATFVGVGLLGTFVYVLTKLNELKKMDKPTTMGKYLSDNNYSLWINFIILVLIGVFYERIPEIEAAKNWLFPIMFLLGYSGQSLFPKILSLASSKLDKAATDKLGGDSQP